MIRAFAVALGVGTQRLVVGLLMLSGQGAFASAFGMAFWLSWLPHSLVAEVYLRRRRDARDRATRARYESLPAKPVGPTAT